MFFTRVIFLRIIGWLSVLLGMVIHIYNPSPGKTEAGGCAFGVILCYIARSRPARVAQQDLAYKTLNKTKSTLPNNKTQTPAAGEMAQQLRVRTALLEDPSPAPSSCVRGIIATYNSNCNSSSRQLNTLQSCGHLHSRAHTYTQAHIYFIILTRFKELIMPQPHRFKLAVLSWTRVRHKQMFIF